MLHMRMSLFECCILIDAIHTYESVREIFLSVYTMQRGGGGGGGGGEV
jgi:hypothetical protein